MTICESLGVVLADAIALQNRQAELIQSLQQSSPNSFILVFYQSLKFFTDILVDYLESAQNYCDAYYNEIAVSDPCTSSSDKVQCYIDKLATFGVTISTEAGYMFNTPNVEELLRIIVSAVETIANRMSIQTGLTPEQVFQEVFAPLEFRYNSDPNTVYAETSVPDDINGTKQTATIELASASFLAPSSPLGESFVVVHELGHVFHNRYANAILDSDTFGENTIVYEYAVATEAHWLHSGDIIQSTPFQLRGVDAILWFDNEDNPLDITGQKTADTNNPQAYIIPNTFWVAGAYDSLIDTTFFPNEISHPAPNPKEGFADSFANLMMRGLQFFESDLRGDYISGISGWVDQIIGI